MGNAAPLAGKTLVLSKTGRPVFLYDAKGTTGRAFAEKMEPLDRKHASFVSSGGQAYRLPPTWEGKTKGAAEGNPAMADGKPVWRLDQVWPPDPKVVANYHPMVWRDGFWVATNFTEKRQTIPAPAAVSLRLCCFFAIHPRVIFLCEAAGGILILSPRPLFRRPLTGAAAKIIPSDER